MGRFNPHKRYNGIYIPEGIYMLDCLTPVSKLVYGRLLRYAGKNGVAYPKQSTIAEELAVSEKSIMRAVKQLFDTGLIEIIQGNRLNHQPNSYYFLEHECLGSSEKDILSDSEETKSPFYYKEESQKEESQKKQEVEVSFKDEWNTMAKENGLSTIVKITGKRKSHLNARVKDYTSDGVLKAIEIVSRTPFLKGDNDRGWTIDFDWFVNETNMAKILEGKYKTTKPKQQQTSFTTGSRF